METRPSTPALSALKIEESARRGRAGGSWVRWFAVALGLALLVSALVFAVRSRAPVVELAEVRVPDDSREVLLNASGYVTPRRRATVAAKITGRVDRILAEEGMRVKEGQVLAILDGSDYRVRLTSAQADRDATAAALQDLQVQSVNADRELRRAEALQQGGVSSQQALDLARTAADSLRAKIELTREQTRAAEERILVARQDLDNCTVRSPFAGMVVSKDAQIGEMVSPISAGGGFTRTGIATVVDMQSLEIEVDVNESYIARVRPAMLATAVLDAYPEWKIPAKVRTVIPTADRQKATVKVRLAFDRLDPRILPDMGVKVTFLGEEGKEQVKRAGAVKALVPQAAVRNENGISVVYIYHEGTVERRAVRTGGTRGSDLEIVTGLSGGEQVVVNGFDSVHDGAKVQKTNRP